MAEQTSRLAIILDSSGAQKNTETLASSLAKLTQAGQKAEKATDDLSGATKDLNSWLKQGPKLAGDSAKGIEDEAKALELLLQKIRPTNKALGDLDSMSKQLSDSFSKGLINESQFNTYDKILSNLDQKYQKLDDEITGVAQSQREAAAAAEKLQQAQEREAASLQKMLDKLNPVSAALRQIEQDQNSLQSALSAGKISGSQFDQYSESLSRAKKEVTGEAQAERDAIKAHDAQAASLQRLVAQLDPVGDAFRRLAQQQKQLDDAKSSGLLSPEAYTSLSSSVSAARGELEKTQQQLLKTGQSAKQTAFAMRMIPAQMTDIVVGLSTGQSPFMVLMQQGGQLKDMFGGIEPAIKGTASYALGLINPFTLGAAAVGLFGAALYSAEKQASAMNITTNNLNNISGLNLNQMTALAQGASALGVSYGDAVTSVGLLSQSLSTQADIYPRIIKASSDYSNASGQDLNNVIGMFSKLSDNSGKSIDALDDKLGFLTVSQRKQADEALRSGNIADAQRIAFDALSGKLEDLTKRLNQGATGWDKFWHSVSRGTSSTWETFKEVVGGDYLDNADVRRYQQRSQQREQGISLGKWTSDDEQHYQMLNKASSAVQSYIKATEDFSTATKNAAGQSYLKSLNSDVNANADAVTKARQAIVAFDNKFKSQPASIQNQGHDDYLARRAQLEQDLSDAQQAADRKNQPPRQRQPKAYTEDAGTRLIDQINQQSAAMTLQLNTTDKLSAITQQRVKFEQQIADIQARVAKNLPITNDQQSLLDNQKKIEQAYKTQETLQNQVTTLDDYRKMMIDISSKEVKQNDTLQKRLTILQKMVDLKKLSPEDAAKQASDLISKSALPDSVISGVNSAGGTLKSGATNSDLTGQGLNMIGLQSNPQLETINKLRQAQTDYATWLNDQEKAINQSSTMNEQQRQAALLDLHTKGADNQKAISTALYATEFASAQTSFSSITDSMGLMFGQQSTAYKAAFATQKAFAIAQASLQLPMAMGQAMANLPFPENLAAIASVVGLMSTITSSITSVAATGFQSGGYTGNGGVSAPAGIVHGQEFVMDAGATRRIGVSNLEAIRKNGLDATLSRSGFGTGAKNVNNNNQTSNTQHLTQHIVVQGGSGNDTAALVQQAAAKGARQGYGMALEDVSSGKGKMSMVLRNTWGVKHKKS